MNNITRPIVGIENRTAQEVFDIMCDRIRHLTTRVEPSEEGAREVLARQFEAGGSPGCAADVRKGGNPHGSNWTIRAMLSFAQQTEGSTQPMRDDGHE